MRVDPDELIGRRAVGVDGLEARVSDEAAHWFALAAAHAWVGGGAVRGPGAVRAQRQLLDGQSDVLETAAGLELGGRRPVARARALLLQHSRRLARTRRAVAARRPRRLLLVQQHHAGRQPVVNSFAFNANTW